jgi:hypothetical protein
MPLESKGQIHLHNRRASNSVFVILKTFTNSQARSKLNEIILSGENAVLRNTFWDANTETFLWQVLWARSQNLDRL